MWPHVATALWEVWWRLHEVRRLSHLQHHVQPPGPLVGALVPQNPVARIVGLEPEGHCAEFGDGDGVLSDRVYQVLGGEELTLPVQSLDGLRVQEPGDLGDPHHQEAVAVEMKHVVGFASWKQRETSKLQGREVFVYAYIYRKWGMDSKHVPRQEIYRYMAKTAPVVAIYCLTHLAAQ